MRLQGGMQAMHAGFFGGEPLLQKELILELADFARSGLDTAGRPVRRQHEYQRHPSLQADPLPVGRGNTAASRSRWTGRRNSTTARWGGFLRRAAVLSA